MLDEEAYDPQRAPVPQTWLELDEGERIELVEAYHRVRKVRLPNLMLHAAMHAAVETQVAMGDELPVGGGLDRLVAEGLDRHDAIHAIASVLAEHMHALLTGTLREADPNSRYYLELRHLTAASWLESD